MKKMIIGIVILMQFYITVQAYDTPTHFRISSETVDVSILELDPEFLKSLGLDLTTGVQQSVFPSYVPKNLEDPRPEDPIYKKKASITEIIAGGSVFEDASTNSINHFYDVQHGGLPGNILGVPTPLWAHSSADWILEINREGKIEQVFYPSYQVFSYHDAMNYFYKALTEDEEDERKRQFGRLFQSLGHIIHHIQDMAQPQHVRNDGHCDAFNDFPSDALYCFVLGQHNPSYYERYTRKNPNDLDFDIIDNIIPAYSKARDYWDNASGTGMAQFTGNNFVSDGTNFIGNETTPLDSHADFPLPRPLDTVNPVYVANLFADDPIFDTEEKRQFTLQRMGCLNDSGNECVIDFIQTTVVDSQSGAETINPRASSLSIFDEEIRSRNIKVNYSFLANYDTERLFTLNRYNFREGYKYLIPRAVAYGAGLINHFFRGRLEVEEAMMSEGEMVVKVKNPSLPDSSIPDGDRVLKNGEFELYYDAEDGERKRIENITISAGQLPLVVDESLELTAEIANDVDTEKEKPFMLVFNAKEEGDAIGEEMGIAAVNFSAEKEITGFLVRANYTPDDGLGRVRRIFRKDGQWIAEPFEGLAGNVDWKGQYVNGKPTKVLTWLGDSTRYFSIDDYQRPGVIYQNGDRYSYVPCGTLGAAIQKDNSGKEWLIAICGIKPVGGKPGMINVYKRPNTKSLSIDLYDPETSPEGWQKLGSFTIPQEIYSSWFFNGDGTEAQTVARVTTSDPYPFDVLLERLKIQITDTQAILTTVSAAPLQERTVTECSFSCRDIENEEDCAGTESFYDLNVDQTISTTGQNVLAVDYLNDQEIVGMFENDSVEIIHSMKRSFRNSQSGTTDGEAIASSNITGYRKFSFSGNELITDSKEGSSRQIDASLSNFQFNINLNQLDVFERSDILYLDIRKGMSLVMGTKYRTQYIGTQSSGTEYAETREFSRITKATLQGTEQSPVSVVVNAINEVTPSGRDRPFSNSSIDASSLCENAGENTDLINYPVSVGTTGTAATDIDGNVAASFKVSSNGNIKFINYLDHGDLKTLIPGAPDDATYDIRVIK